MAAMRILFVVLSVCVLSSYLQSAEVTVYLDQPVGLQGMSFGTNELSNVFLDSSVASTRLAEVRTAYIRYWLPGSDTAKAPGLFDWRTLDIGIARILETGATPMICFEGIPDWMADVPTGKDLYNHPRDMDEWADYVLAVVDHCSQQGYPVGEWLWEIWNEPNISGYLLSEYLELYDAAATRLRSAYPGLQIGGPSTAFVPENWIVTILSGDHDIQFITWHTYGSWDPPGATPDHEYFTETHHYGELAASVQNWIDMYRPGLPNICGELNLNSYCCPIDDRIWQDMFIPYYASVMRHLLLNGCDVEMIFIGTDGAGPGYGLFLGLGPSAGQRSPGFYGKKLFGMAAPTGSELLNVEVTHSTDLEALATRTPRGRVFVLLINKTRSETPVELTVSGGTAPSAVWYSADQASFEDGGIDVQIASGSCTFPTTFSGYGLKAFEICTPGMDCDMDVDGAVDCQDNCPSLANPHQADQDNDGVGDDCDNCEEMPNSDQHDADGDSFGDACDVCPGFDDRIDADGDNVVDGCDNCLATAAGVHVALNGCATPLSDFDRDGDVDQADFGHFQACYTGSGRPSNDPVCFDARLDADTDIDQNDFGIFQGCMSGAGVPATPDCGDR
jgi:hypothetical protein